SWEHEKRRIGVAVAFLNGKPVVIEEHRRKLYRTFPLEQPAYFAPFLIEADFKTDQGRLGLNEYEENGNLILLAIREIISLVQVAIETYGRDQEIWLTWVKWLDLRSLGGAADTFPSISIELRKDLK